MISYESTFLRWSLGDQWVDFVATSARADLSGVAAMRYTQPISPGWGWSGCDE